MISVQAGVGDDGFGVIVESCHCLGRRLVWSAMKGGLRALGRRQASTGWGC